MLYIYLLNTAWYVLHLSPPNALDHHLGESCDPAPSMGRWRNITEPQIHDLPFNHLEFMRVKRSCYTHFNERINNE